MPTRVGPPGQDLNTVFFLDSKRGWVGGDKGFLSSTNDGGHSWVQQNVDTTNAIREYNLSRSQGFPGTFMDWRNAVARSDVRPAFGYGASNFAIPGARVAPDGNTYVPDPNRPGKYLRVQP